ncbi:cytochrome P450 [Sphingobium sp. MK2]|uniref:cytochrome P450 n=1 Tax=Sphingobium sp. MK2 TaxID=3116540 RepID=UPI0032E363DD
MKPFLFDVTEAEFADNPYPTYRRLRDEAPMYRHEETGLWFMTRYADVELAMNDYRTFSSAKGNSTMESPLRVGKTLGSMDPPRHDELRRVVQRAFGPARIEAAGQMVRELTAQKIAELGSSGECDLIADIGRPVLFHALGVLLGLGQEGSRHAGDLTEGLFHQKQGLLGPVLDPEGFQAIFRYLGEQVTRRSETGGDDLISILLEMQQNGAPLSEQELVANMSTVLMAGNASIGHFFSNLMHALWLHPDQRRCVMDNPSLIPSAIEEAVRWDTSTQCFARQTTTAIELHGNIIPANSRIVLFYAAANHDERAIERADQFDIDRKRVRHFGFGLGPHVCAGATIARVMLKIMLEQLLPVLGEYELDTSKATRVEHIMVRGFTSLPMRW